MTRQEPFPFPKPENDTFVGTKTQEKQFCIPTHIAQSEEPWSRLHTTATLASLRRGVMHYDPEITTDSLDFHLKAIYDNHRDFLRNKRETLYQKETLYEDHGRILKNREKPEPSQSDLEEVIRVWIDPQRCSIYSIDGAIESHHTSATNGGYSRKHDGGFYSI